MPNVKRTASAAITADPAVLLDPQSQAFLENPYRAYDVLRDRVPVAEVGNNRWVITGRAEMMSVLRDHARFTSRKNLDGAFPFRPEAQAVLEDALFFRPALFNIEPPRHSAFRSLVGEAFTPRRLREREPDIRALAGRLIRGFLDDGHVDLLSQYAYPLPMSVICDIIGIPADDRATVKAWNNAWLALQVLPMDAEQQLASARTVLQYTDYFRRLLAQRDQAPQDDLLSRLVAAAREPDPICTVDDAIVAVRVMLAAGHETTTNLIANTVLHLLSDRRRWERIVEDRSGIPAAVEEGLRFDSSVQGAPRVATEDVVIGDVVIPAGARVQSMLAAAGRDPALVEDPNTFRLDRRGPARHHGFGYGIHFCIGAPLARLEASIMFETLTELIPDLEIAAGFRPTYQPGGLVFRGLTELPVSWSTTAQPARG
jgi:cytochrome P450